MRPKLHRAAIRRFALRTLVLAALAVLFVVLGEPVVSGLDPVLPRAGILMAALAVAFGPVFASPRKSRSRATLPRALHEGLA